jgi:hypothetical protein
MGLTPKSLDGESAVYVLTLGVVPACRQCGIARSLLGLVQQHAARLRYGRRACSSGVVPRPTAIRKAVISTGLQIAAGRCRALLRVTGC